jgi:ribosomal protein S1
VVRLPVKRTTKLEEGLTEKEEIQEGVYLAGAITKVQAGCAITSIVNTTDEKVKIEEPVLKITEYEPETLSEPPGDDSTGYYVDRPGKVLKQLRLGHLNEEERREIEKHAWNTMIFSTYLERF